MELYNIGLVALIMGLSEIIKGLGLKSKFIPVANIAMGIGFGFLTTPDIKQAIVMGLFMGLSASGLYSGTKNVSEGIRKVK